MPTALIPARGGSKRLPRKNVLPFGGRPMIVWTIEAARQSGLFDRIVVSTEDNEIAAVARGAKATVIARSPSLASDTATLLEVVTDTVPQIDPDAGDLCMLLPNCPLRPAGQIVASYEFWRRGSSSALISVVDYGWTSPFRAQSMDGESHLTALFPDIYTQKSQTYPKVVCPSGAIYWANLGALAAASSLYVERIRGFPMPWHQAIDIDDPADLKLAECIRHCLDTGFSFAVGTDA